MKLLLDSHCWLWYLLAPQKLNEETRNLLEEVDHEIYLSAASVWEIVIKHALGKLELPLTPDEYIASRLEELGHLSLSITQEHAFRVGALPQHHKDPFDRILVAQAQVEKLRLVTGDAALKRYDVELIWAVP